MTQSTFLKKPLLAAIGAAFIVTVENAKPAVAASMTAIDFSVPGIDSTNNPWSLGFQFTTNKTVNVTALGFYDDDRNGLTEAHDVGIFDDSGTLLVNVTVNPEASLDGFFRYTSVAPTVLQAGKTFFIAAATGAEKYTFNPTDFSVNPNITFVASAFRASTTLVFPGDTSASVFPDDPLASSGNNPGRLITSDTNTGYFGPNFKADEVAAVPTPALLPGLLSLGVSIWRKRKADAAKQTNDV